MRDTKREVVIKNLYKLLLLVEGYPKYEDCIGYAIEKLEQEPILDQITEIIEPLRHLPIDEMSDIEWDILRVIDKYKVESKDKE